MIKERNKRIEKFVDHILTILFMILLTIYSLFMDDVRTLVFTNKCDFIFYIITLSIMAIFFIEIFNVCVHNPAHEFCNRVFTVLFENKMKMVWH